MTAFQLNSARLALLALGILCLGIASAAPPPKVEVTGAEPNSALQGEALEVVISGSGFGHGDTVRYLVSGTKDESQINVLSVTYNEADGTLTTSIQVAGGALISDYDIEVQPLSGRRGKGTTLFSVKSSGGSGGGASDPLLTTCDALFGFTPGTCTAAGTADDCELVKEFVEERSWKMTQDCDTRAMWVVPLDHPFLLGDGYRLNLVAPWSGEYAGIANSQGANRIANIHIVVDDPNVADGCGAAGKVQSAVYFDPDLETRSSVPRGAVSGMVVETRNGARFCKGLEFVGSDPYIGDPYKAVGLTENHVMANSYEQVAMEMAYINLSDLNDQVKNEFAVVNDNIVEPSDSICATGIVVGPGVERPILSGNLVYAASGVGCAARTVGIAVLGSGRNITPHPLGSNYDLLTARPADLDGNTVHTGGDGSVGILIDSGTDADTTKSQITAGEGSDFAVCVETGADFAEVGKRSDYIGFDSANEVVTMPDCGAVLP